MSTIQTRIARSTDVDVVAPLFNAYRQFYEQADDLRLAAAFIRERLDLTAARSNTAAQSLYASLQWQLDQVFLAYNLDLRS